MPSTQSLLRGRWKGSAPLPGPAWQQQMKRTARQHGGLAQVPEPHQTTAPGPDDAGMAWMVLTGVHDASSRCLRAACDPRAVALSSMGLSGLPGSTSRTVNCARASSGGAGGGGDSEGQIGWEADAFGRSDAWRRPSFATCPLALAQRRRGPLGTLKRRRTARPCRLSCWPAFCTRQQAATGLSASHHTGAHRDAPRDDGPCRRAAAHTCAWYREGSPGYASMSAPNLMPPVVMYLRQPEQGGTGG